ncbi:carbonic anhydrase [Bdellovibrio sp. 22V]|uniref:carbonic anhydrase n=1 Tax=Bdellovibrio sp. 22V TaxID=3044166 RepID=UPI00254372C3|nr:carbonic anhydrase [Bdellovibrio sp. 22V]WII71788.1 carbonic anhydrase [Bdellovibrio sp. 22V]
MLRLFTLSLLVISVSGCSSIQTKRTPTQDTKVLLKDSQGTKTEAPAQAQSNGIKEITPVQVDEAEADAHHEAAEMKQAVAAAAQHIEATHGKQHSARQPGSVPADKSLGWLKNGNTRFVKGTFRNDGASAKDRSRLIATQKPHAVILSCSDSRVPPEVVFDQKLGEVFVVRTAGESLDNNVIGSIEYAVQHLGANLIVIMGHESCGAVRASLASLQGSDLGSPAINALAEDIKPRIQKYATSQPSQGLLDESWANVDGVARDLAERSAILRDVLASGEVKIMKAMYHLDSGKVEWR